MASELWPVPVPSTNTRALLYMSARYLNTSPRACTASTLPTEPSPQEEGGQRSLQVGQVKCSSTKADPKSEVEKDTLKEIEEQQKKLLVSCLAGGSLAHPGSLHSPVSGSQWFSGGRGIQVSHRVGEGARPGPVVQCSHSVEARDHSCVRAEHK